VRGRSNQFYRPQSPGNPSLAVPPALKLWQESIPLHPSGRSQGVVRRALLGAPEASTTGTWAGWAQVLTMNAGRRFSIGRWVLQRLPDLTIGHTRGEPDLSFGVSD
jgi:hypothetical protein